MWIRPARGNRRFAVEYHSPPPQVSVICCSRWQFAVDDHSLRDIHGEQHRPLLRSESCPTLMPRFPVVSSSRPPKNFSAGHSLVRMAQTVAGDSSGNSDRNTVGSNSSGHCERGHQRRLTSGHLVQKHPMPANCSAYAGNLHKTPVPETNAQPKRKPRKTQLSAIEMGEYAETCNMFYVMRQRFRRTFSKIQTLRHRICDRTNPSFNRMRHRTNAVRIVLEHDLRAARQH